MKAKSPRKHEIDMCNGPILRNMLVFAIPMMCSSVLQHLFNAVDIMVVGRFVGQDSMAAVGATSTLINLITNFFIGLGVGVNIVVARYYAAKDEQEVKQAVHTTIAFAGVIGIVLMFLGFIVAPIALKWMSTPEEILDLAVLYVRIYFLGTGANLVYNFGSAILRSVGDTVRPMGYIVVAGVMNVSLNLFFVLVLNLGVAGVAIATVMSHIVSAILVLSNLIQTQSMIRLDVKQLRIYKGSLIKILKMGIPSGIQQSLFNFANVTVQSSINLFGPAVIVGNTAGKNIGQFINVAQNAFARACLTFMSQNIGARKYERIKPVLFTALGCAIMTGGILGGGAYLAGPLLLSLYTTSSEAVAAGMVKLSIVGVSYVFNGILCVLASGIRGLGYPSLPTIASFFGTCVFRIVWVNTIFQVERFHTFETINYVYPASWIFTSVLLIILYVIMLSKFQKKMAEEMTNKEGE